MIGELQEKYGCELELMPQIDKFYLITEVSLNAYPDTIEYGPSEEVRTLLNRIRTEVTGGVNTIEFLKALVNSL